MPAHSSYTDATGQKICDLLMEGESLVSICELPGMPNRRTVLRWMEADDAFAARCARARRMQADYMDDQIIQLIKNVTPESAPADRVRLAAMQWRAAKLEPKKYGDKLDVTASVTHNLSDMTDEDLAAIATGSGPRAATKA